MSTDVLGFVSTVFHICVGFDRKQNNPPNSALHVDVAFYSRNATLPCSQWDDINLAYSTRNRMVPLTYNMVK